MNFTSSGFSFATLPPKPPAFQVKKIPGTRAIWIDRHEACFVGLFIHSAERSHHRSVHHRPMQDQHHRSRFLRIVFRRDVDKVGAGLLAHFQGTVVVAGSKRVGGKGEKGD